MVEAASPRQPGPNIETTNQNSAESTHSPSTTHSPPETDKTDKMEKVDNMDEVDKADGGEKFVTIDLTEPVENSLEKEREPEVIIQVDSQGNLSPKKERDADVLVDIPVSLILLILLVHFYRRVTKYLVIAIG
jgi:hypothetical protein